MKNQSNPSLACSLLCAAGSFWIAVSELLFGDASAPRRTFHVFLSLASCAVWTAALVLDLLQRKTEAGPEPEQIEQIEEDHDYE